MELSVSVLNAEDKKQMIKLLNKTGITYIHIDVMDGRFVSQISLLPEEIIELSNVSDKKMDIHLMVEDPIYYIEQIKDLKNIEYITIHLEIGKDIKEIIIQEMLNNNKIIKIIFSNEVLNKLELLVSFATFFLNIILV